jgi:hypothetical protein
MQEFLGNFALLNKHIAFVASATRSLSALAGIFPDGFPRLHPG